MKNKEIIQKIIELNHAAQNRAKELNTRAGQDVFKIMSQSEWKDWLLERLGGAVSMETITNPDALRLPELDSQLVAKILTDNPDTITVEGETLTVTYGKNWSEYCARAEVSEEFVRLTSVENVTLPSGRAVELRCGQYSAKTVKELVVKLEAARIERAWQEKRSKLEHTFVASDLENIFPYLSNLLTPVEVTRTDNGEGEPVLGFLALYVYNYFQIVLRESSETAAKETTAGLEQLLRKLCHETLAIPCEQPWYDCSTTDLGRALEARYKTLVTEHAAGLTTENVAERIATLKAAAEKAKAEIGNEHEAAEQLLAAKEEEVESGLNNLTNITSANGSVIKARVLIKQAKDKLRSAEYDDTLANCSEATEIVRQLQEQERAAVAERQRRIDAGEFWPNVVVTISTESQRHTLAFCIALDGTVIEPSKTDDGRGRKSRINGYAYGDLTPDHLVISHETSTYSYMCYEEWRVVLAPKQVTDAQRKTVTRLEDEVREYFRGTGTGWDLWQAGVVAYTTAYSRDLEGVDREAHDEQARQFPVDVNEYERWVGDDPKYGGVHDIDSHVIVIGPHRRQQSVAAIVDSLPDVDNTAENRQAALDRLLAALGQK